MSRPRIAMVLNAPGLGGVTEVARQLIRHLPPGRFETSAFFLKGHDAEDAGRRDRLAGFAELGITLGFARGAGGKVGAIADLAEWLTASRIDIVHTHSYRPNLYGRMAGALCRPGGLRMVAHYHNDYDDKWQSDAVALPLERRLAASTDAMIAVSRQVREHVAARIGISPARIRTIGNGVEVHRFGGLDRRQARRRLGLDQDRIIVGLVGRVCEQKGQAAFVDAAIMLGPRRPDLQFVVFGDIEDRTLHDHLRARAVSAGLGDALVFAGHTTDVPAAYAAVDVLAVPSSWEGFPLVVAEAMAAGCPIVASSVGAIPDMVLGGECAMLVPPRDPVALAGAITRMLEEPQRRAAMIAAGRSHSRSLSWQAAAVSVARIYDRVLATPASEMQCA